MCIRDRDEVEPLQSQFSLTYNSILNLVKNYGEEEIYRILGQNFATYQASAERQGVLVELEILQDELAPYIKNMRGLEQFEQALKKRIELERKLSTAYNKRTRSCLLYTSRCV